MSKKLSQYYSIDEVKKRMESYLDVSQERLRTRLREAWKKQQTKIKAYDRLKV